ncbi:CoA transferase [Mycobacterium heckeshornense]|nr:CoA transferase [Mycobacterium heckeshornense]
MSKLLRGARVQECPLLPTSDQTNSLLGDLGAEVIKIERPRTGEAIPAWRRSAMRAVPTQLALDGYRIYGHPSNPPSGGVRECGLIRLQPIRNQGVYTPRPVRMPKMTVRDVRT